MTGKTINFARWKDLQYIHYCKACGAKLEEDVPQSRWCPGLCGMRVCNSPKCAIAIQSISATQHLVCEKLAACVKIGKLCHRGNKEMLIAATSAMPQPDHRGVYSVIDMIACMEFDALHYALTNRKFPKSKHLYMLTLFERRCMHEAITKYLKPIIDSVEFSGRMTRDMCAMLVFHQRALAHIGRHEEACAVYEKFGLKINRDIGSQSDPDETLVSFMLLSGESYMALEQIEAANNVTNQFVKIFGSLTYKHQFQALALQTQIADICEHEELNQAIGLGAAVITTDLSSHFTHVLPHYLKLIQHAIKCDVSRDTVDRVLKAILDKLEPIEMQENLAFSYTYAEAYYTLGLHEEALGRKEDAIYHFTKSANLYRHHHLGEHRMLSTIGAALDRVTK